MRGRLPEGEPLSRELLANERTLLSWLRTGINAIGFGILLGFADRVLAALSLQPAGMELRFGGFSTLGIAVAAMGVLVQLAALARFVQFRYYIRRGMFTSSSSVYLLLVLALSLLSVAYIFYVALR